MVVEGGLKTTNLDVKKGFESLNDFEPTWMFCFFSNVAAKTNIRFPRLEISLRHAFAKKNLRLRPSVAIISASFRFEAIVNEAALKCNWHR